MPAFVNKRFVAYFLLLLNTALWGFSSPIIKYALNYTSPTTFLLYRFIIATLFFFPIFLLYRARNKPQINLKHHLILALLGTPLTLLPLFYGLAATTAIEGSIIESSSPIFVILGGLIYLKEKIRPKEWIGIMIAVFGTTLLTIYPLFENGLNALSLKGNLLIVLGNVVWAAFLLLSKKNHINPIYLTFYSFLISIPFFLFLTLTTPNSSLTLDPLALPGVLYMAICGSIIAFWAYQEGQKRIEASEAAIFSYLKPMFSIPLAYLWLKEPFTPVAIASTAIIIFGVYLSEKR